MRETAENEKNSPSKKQAGNEDGVQPPPPEKLKSSSFVIQKYIEKPLLVKQRKFDI